MYNRSYDNTQDLGINYDQNNDILLEDDNLEENSNEHSDSNSLTSNNINIECPVCKDEYKQNEAVRLKCSHKVCRDCLLRIFETGRVNCPMCRTPICRPPENEGDTFSFMNE